MELLGIKNGEFTDQKTGQVIPYLHLHVADEDKNIIGKAVEVLKVGAKERQIVLSQGLVPGDNITVSYNKFGKVEFVKKNDKPKEEQQGIKRLG